MGIGLARYRNRFALDGIPCEVVMRAELNGLHSELFVAGMHQASDFSPMTGPDAVRNHRLSGLLPGGDRFEVEAGHIGSASLGITVRRDGRVVHRSDPDKTSADPMPAAQAAADPASDPARLKANKVPIMVDLALGLLFYLVAQFTDLGTAALVGAAAGIALVTVQRFVKIDLTGGLALFGVGMLLISAALAIAFQDDMAVKMRSTIVGTISAMLFLGDGLLGGHRLGKALIRYLPYRDIDPRRLAFGMGALALVVAGLNYAVALLASTDVWLFYTTFVDFFLVMLLILVVLGFARGRLFPRRPKAGES